MPLAPVGTIDNNATVTMAAVSHLRPAAAVLQPFRGSIHDCLHGLVICHTSSLDSGHPTGECWTAACRQVHLVSTTPARHSCH